MIDENVRTCLRQATNAFESEFGSTRGRELFCYFVPGRIEVLGKHTDYAGGRSLLAATSCGVTVVSALNGTDRLRLANADPRFPKAEFPLKPSQQVAANPWTIYPLTAAQRLARNFGGETELRGVDVAFASDLPPASGMSSSSALLVASHLALAGANGIADLPKYKANIRNSEDLAMYLACTENGRSFRELAGDRGVGTFGGSEDHTAMLCCKPGHLSIYSFCPTRFERDVSFPDDLVFVVCHSGIFAEKTASALEKYNAVSSRARKACDAYNTYYKTNHETLADIVRAHSGMERQALLDRFEAIPRSNEPPDQLLDRFRQFVTESEYFIPRAADALDRGDWDEFGHLVDMSHINSRLMLRNIVPEIDFLWKTARKLGAVAASGFGAGFGGSAYAIVRAQEATSFQRRWREAYAEAFPQLKPNAMWLTTRPAKAAHKIEIER